MHQLTLYDEEDDELVGAPIDAPDEVQNAWRAAKRTMKQTFTKLQEMPYEDKIKRQTEIAWEFYNYCEKEGKNCHVSVGGLDSITLFVWLKSIGINVPAITVSGISMCGFGIHLEERPHRFDILREDNPKEWEFYMKNCCQDENGNRFGWGKVLDYIGVEWEDRPQTQMNLFEYFERLEEAHGKVQSDGQDMD